MCLRLDVVSFEGTAGTKTSSFLQMLLLLITGHRTTAMRQYVCPPEGAVGLLICLCNKPSLILLIIVSQALNIGDSNVIESKGERLG